MKQVEEVLGRVAAAIVEASVRHVALTLGLSLLLTIASLYGAVTMLEVDTDSDRLLAAHLPVRQTNIALAEAFPALQNNLVVMIEADDAEDARDAALELRERLAAEPGRYPEIFLPGFGDYYDDFGLYHLDRADLDTLSMRVDQAGPLLATLAERSELPILLAALSHIISSAEGIESLGDDGQRVLDHLIHAISAFNQGAHAPIDWDELLFDDIDLGHTSPQLLFVKPAGDLTQMPPVLAALEHIRAMVPQLEQRPGLRVRVTGDRATHTEEMSLIIHEVAVAGAASLFLVAFVLFYCLRSVRMVIATVLTLLVGLAWTAGLAAVAVGRLNALTSAFAVLYIGLGVDFGIHFALGYLDQRARRVPGPAALRATGAGVGSSLFVCAVTTATGFYAFIPTEYSAVADIGIISGTGVFLGLLATLTFYPALIRLRLGESHGGSTAGRVGLPSFPLRHPRLVCGAAALVALVSSVASFSVRFDFSTLKVRDPRVESVQALADLLQDPELSVWTIDVIARDVEEAAAVSAQLEQLEGVDEVRSALGFLPDDQSDRLTIFQQMRADFVTPVELTDEERGEGLEQLTAVEYTIEGYGVALDIDADLRGDVADDLPVLASAEQLREVLAVLLTRLRDGELTTEELDALEADVFGDLDEVVEDVVDALPTRPVSLEDLPDDLLARYVSADGRARVEVTSNANLNERGELERFSDIVHSVRPDAGGPAAGTVALGRAIVSSLQQALVSAVVVIALVLLLLSRSIKYTIITLVPLAIGSVTTAAVSVFADIPFNFANVIVLPLILGIGVDSGIHLVHRHRSGLLGASNLLVTSTARAVLFSALTTVVSFATLAFSNHQGIASLAQMLCVGVLVMLASNVIVLPAILVLIDGGGEPDGAGDCP
jgi:hopanoid biosynthesis associated RND transporter like protein HpnN